MRRCADSVRSFICTFIRVRLRNECQQLDEGFPFDINEIDERVVLETDTGTLFHVDLQIFVSMSTVFSGMIQPAANPTGRYAAPIPMYFASTAGLRLFLQVMGAGSDGQLPTNLDTATFTFRGDIVEAVRVAMILDVESFGTRAVALLGSSHTCGLRYAIGKAFGMTPPFASIIQNTVRRQSHIDGVITPTGLIYRFRSKLPMIKRQSPFSRNTVKSRM